MIMTREDALRLFSLLFFLCYASAVAASSPGMVEGPPGCSWDATVDATAVSSATDETYFYIRLAKEHGRCMAFVAPDICGIVDKKFRIAVPGYAPEKYRHGETVRVWVSGETASFTAPACTKTPIAR